MTHSATNGHCNTTPTMFSSRLSYQSRCTWQLTVFRISQHSAHRTVCVFESEAVYGWRLAGRCARQGSVQLTACCLSPQCH